MNITLDAEGAEEVQRQLDRLFAAFPNAFTKALHDEALAIFAESQRQVPVDTGTLKLSGFVTSLAEAQQQMAVSDAVVIEVGYGSGEAFYAVFVHEIPKNYRTPGTKHKFLEDPFKAAAPLIPARVADDVRRTVTRGG